MKFGKYLLVILCCLSLALTACATTEEVSAPLKGIWDGSQVILSLRENPSTGYRWVLSESESEASILTLLNDEYLPDDTSETLTGGGGTHVWTFAADKKGTVTLTFDLLPPGDNSPAQTVTYVYQVDDAHTASLVETTATTASITLEENGTTGYVWALCFSGEGSVQVIDTQSTVQSGLIGAPSDRTWVFQGVRPGDGKVTFELIRPW